MKPSDVAKMSVKGIECGDYHITIDPAAYALRVLSSGFFLFFSFELDFLTSNSTEKKRGFSSFEYPS